MSLLDNIEALFHHKKHVEQLADVLSHPPAILTQTIEKSHTVATNASVSLPQISLLPNLSTLLSGLLNVTGLQSAESALKQVQAIFSAGDFTPTTIDNLLNDVKTMLSSVGSFLPNGAFSQIEAEVAKYEAIASKIESGQATDIADVVYTSKSGQKFDLVLSLSVKAQSAA